MEGAAVDASSGGAADDERDADAGAVAGLRGEVRDHVEGAGDEIGELHLGDRAQAHHRRSDGRSDNRGLGDGRVDDAILAELAEQAVGYLEGAAVNADVLAQQEDAVVALHLLQDALADRLHIGRQRLGRGLCGGGNADIGLAQMSLRRIAVSSSVGTPA